MNNCDPCQQYEPAPCVQSEPVEVVVPCVNGEPCPDIEDAHCVLYTGVDLSNIGVKTNDRLDTILQKINTNQHSAGVISVNDSNSVKFSGNGLSSSPLVAEVNIDPVDFNLLTENEDGLKVLFTKENVLHLFDVIENDSDLQARFCDLLNNCANGTCGIPTGVVATIS